VHFIVGMDVIFSRVLLCRENMTFLLFMNRLMNAKAKLHNFKAVIQCLYKMPQCPMTRSAVRWYMGYLLCDQHIHATHKDGLSISSFKHDAAKLHF